MKTRIIYEDKDLFVIHKPAGIAVQSAKVGQPDVESELKNYLARQKQEPFVGLVHRLDQPVEGLLVAAKNRKTAAALTNQLQTGLLKKQYLAVVVWHADMSIPEEGFFRDYLWKEGQLARAAAKEAAGAKEAVLQYRILKKTENIALADIDIKTGRFHQIRCQMAYHGVPLLGDTKYGNETSLSLSRQMGIRQTALCADRIFFVHPVTGKNISYQVTPENTAFAKFL